MSDKASEEISDKKSFIFDSFFFSDKAGFLSSSGQRRNQNPRNMLRKPKEFVF